MTTIIIELPTIEQVDFSINIQPDDIPVQGNALASGNDAIDRQCEDEINRRLNEGDAWAWASVQVIAEWRGVKGSDLLGSCSYKDEEAFKKDSRFEDMKNSAYDDLIFQLKGLQK